MFRDLTRSMKAARRRLAARISGQSEDLVELMIDCGALVASADDTRGRSISGQEAATVLRAARQIANLEGLGLRRVARRFDETRRLLQRSPAMRLQILERCAGLRKKPKAAALVIQVAEAVAAVDGDVSAAERDELAHLAQATGLVPGDHATEAGIGTAPPQRAQPPGELKGKDH